MREPIEVRVPQVNVNDESVRILSWLVAHGAQVKKGKNLVEVETSKATMEIEAPEDGYVQFEWKPGDEVAVGAVLCRLLGEASASVPSDVSSANSASTTRADRNMAAGTVDDVPLPSAPATLVSTLAEELKPAARLSARARVLAEANGLPASLFNGKGLIRERELLTYIQKGASTSDSATNASGVGGSSSEKRPTEPRETVPVRRQSMSRRKRMEVKVLTAGNAGALASSVTVTCPTRGLRRLARNDSGLRGNSTALIVFETARILRQFPMLNGYCRGDEICQYEQVNIGFAVDAGFGLKVLVVHDADTKSAASIADEMHGLVGCYLEDRLPMQALAGGTFTVTDLSAEGVAGFSPLIHQDQAAILGLGAEKVVPQGLESEFNLILTFDHQVAEGLTAARFLNALRDRLLAHEAALTPAAQPSSAIDAGVFCGNCMRTASQLRRLQGYLLRSAYPDGYLCNLCLTGY